MSRPCKLCGVPASRIAPRTSITAEGPGYAGLWAFLCEAHIAALASTEGSA